MKLNVPVKAEKKARVTRKIVIRSRFITGAVARDGSSLSSFSHSNYTGRSALSMLGRGIHVD